MGSSGYLFLRGVLHLSGPSFLLLFSLLSTYKPLVSHLSARIFNIRRPGPGLLPNSETGDIPGFCLPEQERPTVKRVYGRREDPTGLRPLLVKTLIKR